MGRWLTEGRPEHLKSLATRVGIRVANSKRYRRSYRRAADRHLRKAQANLNPGKRAWSALKGRGRRWRPVTQILWPVVGWVILAAITRMAGAPLSLSYGLTMLILFIGIATTVRSPSGPRLKPLPTELPVRE